MLPFTQERLTIQGNTIKDVFYYNRNCFIPEVYIFSNAIFNDLYNYLGIEFELNQRRNMSGAVDEKGNPKYYDEQKINRITLLYDFYVDTLLKTMQLLYYEIISQPDLYLFCDTVTGLLKTQYVQDENNIKYNGDYNLNTEQLIQDSLGKTKKDSQAFLIYFDINVKKTGKRLSDCFKQALEKCHPIRTMIEQQINIEFPIETFSDKIVKKEKIVVSNKKTLKK